MAHRFRSLFLVLMLAAASAFAGETLSVDAVIAKADELNDKPVAVKGKVLDFKQKTSKIGNPYFTFKLKGAKDDVLNVYSRGKSEKTWKDGDEVLVQGVFRKEKKVTSFTVKNEIDATPVEKKPYGVKAAAGS